MMFLRIIINLIVFFMLFGCGFMFDGRKKGGGSDLKVSDEIKSFVVGMAKGSDVNSVLKESIEFSEKSNNISKANHYQKEDIESCESGGSVDFITDDSNTSIMRVIADDCIDSGIKINYSASVRIEDKDSDLEKIMILLNEDATFEDLETTITTTFLKNSTMTIDELSVNEEIVTQTVKISISTGERQESIDLVSYNHYEENNYSLYEVSGQRIYNGVIYSVDEAYDSSKTPLLFIYEDDNEFLVSGVAKYYNEQHQHITIEVVGKDMIKIYVDIDNNGKNDVVETILI